MISMLLVRSTACLNLTLYGMFLVMYSFTKAGVQTTGLIASQSGGGAFESSTIVMKNRIFIPVPEGLRGSFLPAEGEKKKLEVRCDILYTDHGQ